MSIMRNIVAPFFIGVAIGVVIIIVVTEYDDQPNHSTPTMEGTR